MKVLIEVADGQVIGTSTDCRGEEVKVIFIDHDWEYPQVTRHQAEIDYEIEKTITAIIREQQDDPYDKYDDRNPDIHEE